MILRLGLNRFFVGRGLGRRLFHLSGQFFKPVGYGFGGTFQSQLILLQRLHLTIQGFDPFPGLLNERYSFFKTVEPALDGAQILFAASPEQENEEEDDVYGLAGV